MEINFTSSGIFQILKSCLLWHVLLICLISNAQEFQIACGAEPGSDSYLNDRFYGNNQKLVEILLEHGLNIDKNYLENLDNYSENSMTQMFFKEPFQYDIPIKAWVYRNNNGTGNFTSSQIYQIIDYLNDLYASTNINFFLLCDINFVNNSNYANNGAQYFNDYTLNNKTQGALNIHFVIRSGPLNPQPWGGKANFPFPVPPIFSPNPRAYSGAVIFSDPQITADILGHEIGHTLGLYHTHHPGRNNNHSFNEQCGDCYQESVSRSRKQGLACVSTIGKKKCEVNGDFLCDTAADPLLSNTRVNSSCIYTYGGTDNWGDSWAPNTNNIMSYTRTSCFSYFSPLQKAKMYGYIGGIGISYPALNISGPNNLCLGNIATYSVPYQSGVTFFWEMPYNMNLLSGQGTNSVVVQSAGNYGGVIQVTPSCGNRAAKKTILNIQEPEINGYDQACPFFTYTYSTPYIGNADYEWSVTNGYIVSGQYTNQVQIALTQSPTQQTIIDLELTNVCDYALYGQKIVIHGDPPFPAQQCFSHQNRYAESLENRGSFISDRDILLYPNPASTAIDIIIPNEEKYNVVLLDIAGRKIYESVTDMQQHFRLDIHSYPEGTYIIHLTGKHQTFSKRLILKR